MSEVIYARPKGLLQSEVMTCLYCTRAEDNKWNEITKKKLYNFEPLGTLKQNKFVAVDRTETLEEDQWMEQLVVGAVIHCGSKFLFLNCLYGVMKGKTTLVEGHCVYDNDNQYKDLASIGAVNIKREIVEEIKPIKAYRDDFSELVSSVSKKTLRFITTNQHDITATSYKHIGLIYDVEVKNIGILRVLQSNEPKVNDVIIIDIKGNLDGYKFDSWTREIISFFNMRK